MTYQQDNHIVLRGIDFVWCMLKNFKCTFKDSHVIDKSLVKGYMFKTLIETKCLRCKCPLYIEIDSINDCYWVCEA